MSRNANWDHKTLIETLRSPRRQALLPVERFPKTNEFDWRLGYLNRLDGPARVTPVRPFKHRSGGALCTGPARTANIDWHRSSGFDNLVLAETDPYGTGLRLASEAAPVGVPRCRGRHPQAIARGCPSSMRRSASAPSITSVSGTGRPYSLTAQASSSRLAAPEFLLQRSCDHYLNRDLVRSALRTAGPVHLG